MEGEVPESLIRLSATRENASARPPRDTASLAADPGTQMMAKANDVRSRDHYTSRERCKAGSDDTWHHNRL